MSRKPQGPITSAVFPEDEQFQDLVDTICGIVEARHGNQDIDIHITIDYRD